MPTEIPEIKNYKLCDLIGCGGMGSVYAGYNGAVPVAVKVLSPECTGIEAIVERFKLEGRILKSLNHPNIVKFVEAGQEGPFHYLAMEFVKGISMDSLPMSHSASSLGVYQSRPSMEEYLSIFIKCMTAMAYFHKLGLVHRDIKPQNIILHGSNYTPHFIDFGIAKYVKDDDDLNLTEERLYTVVYASPEQLTNKPVDIQSDLFSFGVVMYEKLTGRLPFVGKSEMEVFLAHTKSNYSPPRQLNPEIPAKLEQIILKLLTRDPEQRYPTATMVQGELEKLADVIRSGRAGLAMTGIVSDIRELPSHEATTKRSTKRRSLSDEITAMKKAQREYVDSKTQLRQAMSKYHTEPEKIEQLQRIAETFRQEYEKLQQQTKMSLGFRSQPVVVDRFNIIFKLESLVYEKRGVPFTINTIEQKLANSDGSDILVGSVNFTDRAKRLYSLNHKEDFMSWDESNWFFGIYDEKVFPIYLMVGSKGIMHPPKGFRGFFWPFEFVVAMHKLGQTGVSIIETITGVDRNGTAGFAIHKETILFSQNIFEAFKQSAQPKGKVP